MKGFKINAVAKDLVDSLNTKELDGLKKVVQYFGVHFPKCDFYPGYKLAGGVSKISLGKKKLDAKVASYCVFRVSPNLGNELNKACLYLVTDSEKTLIKEIAELISFELNPLNKDALKLKCTFSLADLSNDISQLANFLDKLKNSKLFFKALNGGGYLPDSYEKESNSRQPSDEPTDRGEDAVTEGAERLREDKYLSRNKALMNECKKRDDYACQACDTKIKINNRYIIDCHHTIPLAKNGERVIELAELVSLCPNCHRIAHTRSPTPYDINEIRVLRKLANEAY
jgi:5-methylcytosine-specific restriction endonuclease McrA